MSKGGETLEEESFNLLEPIKTIHLDVEQDESVNKAAKFVAEELRKNKQSNKDTVLI